MNELAIFCKCGHGLSVHHRGKSCTEIINDVKLKYCKCEEFRGVNSNNEGEAQMAKSNGKKDNTRLVVRYEPTVKDAADLLAKDNVSQSAAMYRALVAAKEPLTIRETYKAAKMESQAAYERLGKNLNSTLFALRKAGFVKKTERREEVSGKANGVAKKPKAARKPRKPRAVVTKPEAAQETAAA